MSKDQWSKLAKIHGHLKELTLNAEELAPEHQMFMPPIVQQRDAHDHVMRAKTAELGLKPFPNEESRCKYIAEQLDKAIGHEYRAFFDIADWYAILLREQIAQIAGKYNSQAIQTAVPHYYTTIKPRTLQANAEIAGIRNRKDIGGGDGLLEEVAKYREVISVLEEDRRTMVRSEASMLEVHVESRRTRRNEVLFQVGLATGSVVLGIVLGWLWCKMTGTPQP